MESFSMFINENLYTSLAHLQFQIILAQSPGITPQNVPFLPERAGFIDRRVRRPQKGNCCRDGLSKFPTALPLNRLKSDLVSHPVVKWAHWEIQYLNYNFEELKFHWNMLTNLKYLIWIQKNMYFKQNSPNIW